MKWGATGCSKNRPWNAEVHEGSPRVAKKEGMASICCQWPATGGWRVLGTDQDGGHTSRGGRAKAGFFLRSEQRHAAVIAGNEQQSVIEKTTGLQLCDRQPSAASA